MPPKFRASILSGDPISIPAAGAPSAAAVVAVTVALGLVSPPRYFLRIDTNILYLSIHIVNVVLPSPAS